MNLFQKLFGTREKELSKIEYWKKWEFFELFDDLHKAERLLTSGRFIGNADVRTFRMEFIEELYEIEGDNVVDFARMWIWFSPDKEWDNKIGSEGSELGKLIFRRIDRWKRNQEFIPGTKVSLDGEFGVVLDRTVDSDLVGLIRWDSEKEEDEEDWRGLFGSFLQAGGQVIEQDHEFKFIDDLGAIEKGQPLTKAISNGGTLDILPVVGVA